MNEGSPPPEPAPPPPPSAPESLATPEMPQASMPLVPSDTEVRAAQYVPQGQGFAPPPVAPPHAHDFYGARQFSAPARVPSPPQAFPPRPMQPAMPHFGAPMPGYGPPGYAPGYAPPGYPPQSVGSAPFGFVPPFGQAKPHSGKAIASLVLGITNLLFVITAVIAAPVGLILAFMAMKDTRPEGPMQGRGLAIGGLVLNLIGVVMCAVVGLAIAGIVIAEREQKAQRYDNEVSADFDTVRARLSDYYFANNKSLGPGGDAIAADKQGKVSGQLQLADLVTRSDMRRRPSEYSFSVTGKAGARMTHIRTGREMEVTDIEQNAFYISPGRK